MKLLNKAICLLFIVSGNASASVIDFNTNTKVNEYPYGVEELVSEILADSFEVKAIHHEINSKLIKKSISDYYFIPDLQIEAEFKVKKDRPGAANVDPSKALTFTSNTKLWGDGLDDADRVSELGVQISEMKLNSKVNEIYYQVYRNLFKIDASRVFLDKSLFYEDKMNALILDIEQNVKSGLIKKSELLFSQVTMKKFVEKRLSVESKIDEYKETINSITGGNKYNSNYGVAISEFNINLNNDFFDVNTVINNNAMLAEKRFDAELTKHSALSQNEMVSVDFVVKQGIFINEATNDQSLGGDIEYSFDSNEESYVGLNLKIKGINFASKRTKDSELELYKSSRILLDKEINDVVSKIKTYKSQYKYNKNILTNLDEQVTLTHNVIKRQFEESKLEESNVVDILRNISTLVDLEINSLDTTVTLVDINSNVLELNSLISTD